MTTPFVSWVQNLHFAIPCGPICGMWDAVIVLEDPAFRAEAKVYNPEILLQILGDLDFRGTLGFLSCQGHLVLLQSNWLRSVERSSAMYGEEKTFPAEDRKRILILSMQAKWSTGTLRSQLPSRLNLAILRAHILYVYFSYSKNNIGSLKENYTEENKNCKSTMKKLAFAQF